MTEAPPKPFADRLAALVEERSSQVCVGLDPDPGVAGRAFPDSTGEGAAEKAANAVSRWCRQVLAGAGAACVAAKLQLACFERLGGPGWQALGEVADACSEAGLLTIADGKRGDVPVSSTVYAQSLLGSTPTPFGEVPGLAADAATVNGTLGLDSLEPLIDAAETAGGGLFVLVRTSNPGAADFLDLPVNGRPFHEALGEMVGRAAPRLAGASGLSGMGAVVGATAPQHLERLRTLMPDSVFLLPGVGTQGGSASALGPAFGRHPASALITASRSIAGADDPGAAAETLRKEVWEVACRAVETG